MIKAIAQFTLLVVSLTLPSFGAQAQTMSYGQQDVSCDSWTQDRELDGIRSHQYQAWVTGFISGAEWTSPLATADTDAGAIVGWTDQYCAENPLHDLHFAATVLVSELKGEANK